MRRLNLESFGDSKTTFYTTLPFQNLMSFPRHLFARDRPRPHYSGPFYLWCSAGLPLPSSYITQTSYPYLTSSPWPYPRHAVIWTPIMSHFGGQVLTEHIARWDWWQWGCTACHLQEVKVSNGLKGGLEKSKYEWVQMRRQKRHHWGPFYWHVVSWAPTEIFSALLLPCSTSMPWRPGGDMLEKTGRTCEHVWEAGGMELEGEGGNSDVNVGYKRTYPYKNCCFNPSV